MGLPNPIQSWREKRASNPETKAVSPPSRPLGGLHATGLLIGFSTILVSLAFVALVGMRVSWVPLRDTADGIGLHEVREFYPLVIDGLDGLAVVASLALVGSAGYRWAIGTVVGLTAISLVLNVAHGSAFAKVTGQSDATTWGHVILASAAPTVCIALGTHLAALTFHRLTGVLFARRERAETAEIPTLLTTRQVAELLEVKPSTISTWVDRGKLTVAQKDPKLGNLFDPETL
ncbi:helix-turn-helix domain-containing protein [Streptomyces sp. NPDC056721]|uniref:helix-turn-helix domain-containing protein n=1 Tax=Streptomyces sp. NPDC056721 TaxID=3345923 RepID=UPI0036CBA1CB